MSGAVEDLIAKQQIREVILRYCRGVDRMDRELVRTCYHPDATDTHGSFHGGVDEYIDWAWGLLERYSMRMHFVGNLLIEVRGRRAAAETYGIAFHHGPEDKPHLNLTTGFRYLDRFERRDENWRIAARVGVTEWSRRDDTAGRWPVPAELLQGTRAPDDALYELLGWLES